MLTEFSLTVCNVRVTLIETLFTDVLPHVVVNPTTLTPVVSYALWTAKARNSAHASSVPASVSTKTNFSSGICAGDDDDSNCYKNSLLRTRKNIVRITNYLRVYLRLRKYMISTMPVW